MRAARSTRESAQRIVALLVIAANEAADRIVPAVVDVVVSRIDLTGLVVDRVDFGRVIGKALDSVDLTQVVLDRVDIDAVIRAADLDAVVDRLPIVEIADYVIDEIDLPQIIRDSTSGIAGDAMNTVRRQSRGADQLVSRLADRIVLRRGGRKVDAPGDPESLARAGAEALREERDGEST